MSTEPKDGTKNVPPPTSEEGSGRVTAETIVAKDGSKALERTEALLRALTGPPRSRQD